MERGFGEILDTDIMISLKVEHNDLKGLIKRMPKIYKSAAQQLPYAVQMYIGEELGIRKVSATWRKDPSGTGAFGGYTKARANRLSGKSGDLYRSFDPRSEDFYSLRKAYVNKKRFGHGIGTKLIYASVHEYGKPDRIYGKPVTGKKYKTRMEGYFWAKYFENNEKVFMFTALKLRKLGYINVKKRPFFFKSIKKFLSDKRYGLHYFLEIAVIKPAERYLNAR